MIKGILKELLNKAGILPPIIYYQKKIFPSVQDKMEEELAVQYKAFYSRFINKNDLCFDIGAHMGNRIEAFLHCRANVIAVEPYSPCYNFIKFKYGNSIKLVKKGVGQNSENGIMFLSNDPTTNSLSSNWIKKVSKDRFKERKWKKQIEIKMTSIDDLIEEYGLPDFCKIDIEGFEYEALKGLSKTIKIISFEYTVPEEINLVTQCINRLLDINNHYTFNYSEGETMIFALEKFVPGEEFKKIILDKNFIESSCGDIYATISSL